MPINICLKRVQAQVYYLNQKSCEQLSIAVTRARGTQYCSYKNRMYQHELPFHRVNKNCTYHHAKKQTVRFGITSLVLDFLFYEKKQTLYIETNYKKNTGYVSQQIPKQCFRSGKKKKQGDTNIESSNVKLRAHLCIGC